MSTISAIRPTVNARVKLYATPEPASPAKPLDRAIEILEARMAELLARPARSLATAPVQFVPGLDTMRADMAKRFDADGFPIPQPAVPAAAPIIPNIATQFDVTRDNGEITAHNPKTGNTVRFRITTQDWYRSGRVVAVANAELGGWDSFAFADECGIRVWGLHSKTVVPYDLRVRYARFLENLTDAASKGVELTFDRV